MTTLPDEEKIEEAKPLKLYTVYANKPFWCEVEAPDEEEAKRLAPILGCWDECHGDDDPEEEDIYCVEEVSPEDLKLRREVEERMLAAARARVNADEEKDNA